MRRQIIGIITILCILFALVGCSNKDKETASGKPVSKQETEQEADNEEASKNGDGIEQEETVENSGENQEDAKQNSAQQPNAIEQQTQQSTATSVPKVEAIPGQHRDPNTAVVVIDPGHQLRGDSTKEPNGPGSTDMKARVASGTTGVATRVPEYVMTLDISLKLKTELENRGYTVYMTRSVHEVNISNKERAEYATTVGADIAVRIHGNGSTNQSIQGAEAYVPSASNPYVSHLANASNSLGRCIIDAYCAATGFKNRGVFASDTMSGMNWSSVPVAILEVGYMSNAEEDLRMQDATIQNNMVQGIANGIDAYFGF